MLSIITVPQLRQQWDRYSSDIWGRVHDVSKLLDDLSQELPGIITDSESRSLAPERFRQLYDVTKIAPLIAACEKARDAGLAMMGWPDPTYLRAVPEAVDRPPTASEVSAQFQTHAEELASRLYWAAKSIDRQILDLPVMTANVDAETLSWVADYKRGLFDPAKVEAFVAALTAARDVALPLIDWTLDGIRTEYEGEG